LSNFAPGSPAGILWAVRTLTGYSEAEQFAQERRLILGRIDSEENLNFYLRTGVRPLPAKARRTR
jgi:hypothetical protein